MKKICCLLLLLAMMLPLAACAAGAVETLAAPAMPPSIPFDDPGARLAVYKEHPLDDLTDAFRAFAYDTAFRTIAEDPSATSLYSPMSLYLALALTAAGAKGGTADELYRLLRLENADDPAALFRNLWYNLYADNEVTTSRPALALWVNSGADGIVDIRDSFLTQAKNNYFSSVFRADFADPQTPKQMSGWVREQTEGMIEPLIELYPDSVMTLFSTLYFRDEWTDRFDSAKTAPDLFHCADGSEKEMDFMNAAFFSHGFARGDGWTRSSLSLKGGGSVTFVLPDEETGLEGLLQYPALDAVFTGGEMKSGEVIFKLPKIDVAVRYDLIPLLRDCGLDAALSDSADFSGITDGTFFISGVTQENAAVFDEKGVSAASFTMIQYTGAAMPVGRAEMILDRPFLFMITDRFGLPLFIGAYNG